MPPVYNFMNIIFPYPPLIHRYTRTDISVHHEMSARLITAYGATGRPARRTSSPCPSHSCSSGFAIRAITRNPDSEKALALKKAGAAELFKGNLEDRSTIDAAAVAGAYRVFLDTDRCIKTHE